MAPKKNPLQRVSDLLGDTRDEIRDLLKAPEHNVILLGVESDLTRTINRIAHIGGLAHVNSSTAEEYQPIKEFMGEKLDPLQPLDLASLEVDDQEVAVLAHRRDKLFAEFISIEPQGILNDYVTSDDVIVLRAVAKKAGLEDYRDREIDLEFIEDIALAIKGTEKERARQGEENERLQKEDHIVKLKETLEGATTRRAALDIDLTEAQEKLALAKAPQQEKAQKLVKEIQDEIVRGDKWIAGLTKELEDLQA